MVAPIYAARAKAAQGTEVEAEALTPAMQQLGLSGYGAALVKDPNMGPKSISIFQGLNPAFRRNRLANEAAAL